MKRSEAHRAFIRTTVVDRTDITLAEPQEHLSHGAHAFEIDMIWRFFARHAIKLKKTAKDSSSDAPMS